MGIMHTNVSANGEALGRRIRGPRAGPLVALSVALAVGLGGCAGRDRPPPIMLSWPEPPEFARIEYVSTIAGVRDVVGPPSFWDRLARFVGIDPTSRAKNLVQPSDVEVSPDAQVIYVSDFASGVVHIFDLANRDVRYLGLSEPLQRPAGLALDSAGNLYVAEQGKAQIRVFDPQGNTLRIMAHEELARPVDIALDESRGRLYVADPSYQNSKKHYVRIFDLEGNYLGELGKGRGVAEGYLLFPTYVAVAPSGDVYVSDTMNSRVSVFDAEGEFLRTVGMRGDGFGLFDKPKGVALDSFGNLYVVDSSWSNVQIFGHEGDVLLYFGGRGGYPGLMRNPTGIAIARASNTIFVGDYLNRRISIYRLVNTSAGDSVAAPTNAEPQASP